MGRETQGRGRQTVTLPPLPPRRVPRRMTSKGAGRSGGLKDLETGGVASRAVPVPGPMADPGTQAATAGPGTQAATAGPEPRAAMTDRELRVTMADPGPRTAIADRVYGPPKKSF